MPFINGRFYLNPAYGRAVERARVREHSLNPLAASGNLADMTQAVPPGDQADGHWVTIGHRHVLIHETQAQRKDHSASKPHELSPRDKAYLDKYYDAVLPFAREYDVDPALVLGVGIESGFASAGTYLRTGHAFGMTGGSTKHMTTAVSPADNVKQFFDQYGRQIRGTNNDVSAFLYGLEGRNRKGDRVLGWKIYNSKNPN